MAIQTLAEIKSSVTATEIAPFEKAINDFLATPETVAYLSSTEQKNKVIVRLFNDRELTVPGQDALRKAILDAGWIEVIVRNQPSPPREGLGSTNAPSHLDVFVSFKPAAAPSGVSSGSQQGSGS